ncbi:hypothetical protein AL755_11020 [Arthrobacter sp. ERGS1:01]|uniref:toll/interleukin-1 receptor domain-containing protein n=1 Tax=Arthrobacter sp. ERGS1:01 TaxID=1704044 RepID=UPI0006B47B83|nr:toll/interleukin-1 receptor domain-containing protein [Arthrobacter sp. ERGS1:01]ALE05875.1 hypothetical protein AL755_11020 [Arthrobacter sp. ERGS1:01]
MVNGQQPEPDRPRRFFVSYARADRENLAGLLFGLETMHHQVWIDSKLDGGQAWWDEILASIRACDAMVVAVSNSLINSEAARLERAYAQRLGKPLVPVVVAPVNYDFLPPEIAAVQLIDHTHPDSASSFRVASALNALPLAPPLPNPLPAPPPVPVSYMSGIAQKLRKPVLSEDEQRVIVGQLRDRLARPRDPADRAGAIELLGQMSGRTDLLHMIGQEVDQLLYEAQTTGARVTASAPRVQAQPTFQAQPRFQAPPNLAPPPGKVPAIVPQRRSGMSAGAVIALVLGAIVVLFFVLVIIEAIIQGQAVTGT